MRRPIEGVLPGSSLHTPLFAAAATSSLDWLKALLQLREESSVRGRFARAAAWTLLGTMVAQALKLLAIVVVARLLGRQGFGELGMIQSTVGTLGVFAGLGLGITATKYVAQLRRNDPDRAGRVLGITLWAALLSGAVMAGLLQVLAPWLAGQILQAPHLTLALRLGSGLLLLQAVTGTQTGALAGLEAFKSVAGTSVLQGLVSFPCLTLSVLFGGLPGALVGMLLTALLGVIILQKALRREVRRAGLRRRQGGIWREWRILWEFSLPALLSGAMVRPVHWLAQLLLARQPHGYEELGLFNAADQWRLAVTFAPAMMVMPLLSLLSNLRSENQGAACRGLLWGNAGVVFVTTAASAGMVALASPWILQAYGREFTAAQPALLLLLSAAVLHATASIITQAIATAGRMWWVLLLNSAWALSFLLGGYCWIGPRGASGLAAALLASYGVLLVGVVVLSRSLLGNAVPLRSFAPLSGKKARLAT